MKGYVFNNDDFIQIDNLIKVTSYIDKIYSKLYNLEINGKKDTVEYKKLLENLNLAIQLENKQYEEYNLNYWKCVAWHRHFLDKKAPIKFINDMESLMQHDYNYRVVRRILGTLEKKMTLDYENLKDTLPLDMTIMLKQMGMYNNDRIFSNIIDSSLDVINSLEIDILNAYLTFLEEFVRNKEYKYLKKDLISSKYNLSFINKKIESNLISDSFEVSDTLYINSKFFADLLNLDFRTYNNLRNSNGEEKVMAQIMELLEIGDIDYNETNKVATSVLRQCLIRATLLNMGDDMVSKVNSKFCKYIADKKYLEKLKAL